MGNLLANSHLCQTNEEELYIVYISGKLQKARKFQDSWYMRGQAAKGEILWKICVMRGTEWIVRFTTSVFSIQSLTFW